MTETLAPPQATERRLAGTPFVGLVPYGEGDAAFFFGRDEEKEIVAGNLRAARLTILYGASGVGKSSLLHAGVVHDLHEQVHANAAGRTARTPFAICAFSTWRDDPLPLLAEAMRAACVEALGGEELPAWRPGEPLLDAVRAWTERVRPLLVVLDQFEDYFLYHPGEDGEGTFAVEFPRLVNEPNLHVNFVLSLREDAWAKLDRFEGRIPALFANYVRVEHLDRKAAREAIEGPVEEWNRRLPPGDESYEVEPALVETVIEAAAAGGLGVAEGGDGAAPETARTDAVEAPFLQLVLERLWRATVEAGAHTLDLARLEALGGAQQIVENHLLEALGKLTPGEQAVAADVFRFLVTRSKTKIAHPASDLAEWTKRPEPEVTAVLDKLCRGESGRILRSVSPPADETAVSYELFHDVLAEPILEWRRDYEQERAHRLALKRFGKIGGALLALVAVFLVLTLWALKARSDAVRATASATSIALASAADKQLTGRLDASLLMSLEAYRKSPTAQAASSMISSLEAARRSGAEAIIRTDQGSVSGVAFSPDGRTLATASAGTVRLWDARTHTQLGQPLKHQKGVVTFVAFSPDGDRLAVAGGDYESTVQLWDVHTRTRLGRPRKSQQAYVYGLAFSPDGHTLAVAGSNSDGIYGMVRLLDIRTPRKPGQPLKRQDAYVNGVAFSPDGHTLATASDNGTVRLWDMRTPEKLGQPLVGHKGSVRGVAFSPDGHTLATAGDHGTVLLWDIRAPNKPAQSLKGHRGSVNAVAFSLDGHTVATAGADGTVRLWDVRTHTELGRPRRGHRGSVNGVAFRRDGRTLASAGDDGTVRLWNVVAHRQLGQELRGDVHHVQFSSVVAFSPDGRTLAAATSDGSVQTWGVPRARTQLGLPSSLARPPAPIRHSCRSDKGQPLPCLPPAVVSLPNGAKWPVGAAFSTDGRTLATASDNGTVRLWDVHTHTPLGKPLRGYAGSFMAFSPDGRTLASAGEDGTVRLWDVGAQKQLARLRGRALSAYFSPDGRTLATAGAGNTVRLWNVETHTQLGQPLRGHTSVVSSVAFSPDGRTLATAGADHTVRLWNVQKHTQIGQPLRGHTSQVQSVAFSPDGRTLASIGDDRTLRLWDVRTHVQLGQVLRADQTQVWSVAFSPDGRTLATAGDGGVRLWEGILWRDFSDLKAQVCGLVFGNLTKAAWDAFAPGLDHGTTCPD